MELEEAIRMQNKFIKIVKSKDYDKEDGWHAYYDDELIELGQALETVLQILEENKTALEEKDKIIDLMSESLYQTISIQDECFCCEKTKLNACIDCIKDYFRKKVTNERRRKESY